MNLSKFQYKMLKKIARKPFIPHSELRKLATTEEKQRRFDNSLCFFSVSGLIQNTLATDYASYVESRENETSVLRKFSLDEQPFVNLLLTESGYSAIETYSRERIFFVIPVVISGISTVIALFSAVWTMFLHP